MTEQEKSLHELPFSELVVAEKYLFDYLMNSGDAITDKEYDGGWEYLDAIRAEIKRRINGKDLRAHHTITISGRELRLFNPTREQ